VSDNLNLWIATRRCGLNEGGSAILRDGVGSADIPDNMREDGSLIVHFLFTI